MNYAPTPNVTPSCWNQVVARLFHYFEFMAIGVSTEMTTQNPLLLYPANPDA